MGQLIAKFVATWRGRFAPKREVSPSQERDFPRMRRTLPILAVATVAAVAMAAPQFTSKASISPAEDTACVEAGRHLVPWFEAEAERKAQVGLSGHDDFNRLLAWFRAAQLQCASGEVDRALQNIKAVGMLVSKRVGRRQPERDED